MKTIKELNEILSKYPLGCVDSHVHTHLCDGAKEMTVENIAEEAMKKGIELVILTPHFHRQVSDETAVLYEDTDESILSELREEINFYEKKRGNIKFLLSTEADILSVKGELAVNPSFVVERALDLITPTMNYNPVLPLCAVELTYGRCIDEIHQSGKYAEMAKKAGGVGKVLEAMYECEANAVLNSPYPSMLGHFFAAHSIANDLYSWFGAEKEHLPIMHEGADKVLKALKEKNAFVDITGIHPKGRTAAEKQKNDDFLYVFQKSFFDKCNNFNILVSAGSDAHGLNGVGSGLDYYKEVF